MKRFNFPVKRLTAINGTLSRRTRSTLSAPKASNDEAKPFQEMPTEKGSSFLFGVGPETNKGGNLFTYIRQLADKHGKLFRVKAFPGKYMVIVANTEDADIVIRNEGKYPSRGPTATVWRVILDSMKENVSSANLLVTSEGQDWQNLRSLLNPVVMPRKLGRHVHRLNDVCETFLELAQASVQDDGYSKDLMEFLPSWSAEAISRFLYPLPVCFQKTNDPRIYNIFEGMQDFINASSAYLYPEFVLKYFPVKAVKVGKEGFKKYKKATLEVLKEMEEKMKSSSEDFTEGTFMEQWKSQGLSYDAIIAIMADFMAAGTDTTVNTMGFVLHKLALNHQVQEKAHEEVLSVVGNDGIITDEAMHKLSYVKAIQKETARFSSFSLGTARVLEENVVIGGYEIPAKTFVVITSGIMGQDQDIFEDPEEFRPDRWLRDTDNQKRHQQQLATGVFGFGPRNCLGRRIAELEMWTLLAKIMQKTRLELHPNSVDLQPTGVTSFRPDRPLRVKFESF
jgi:cytochrome P450